MNKWHRTYKDGKELSVPPEQGMYWITDGYNIEIAYWHPTAGWGVDNGGHWNPKDDWNVDAKYWKNITIPVIPKRIKESF